MFQEFTATVAGTHLSLLEKESGWDFTKEKTVVSGIQEELFSAHCERLKNSLAKDMPHPWETWRVQPFHERVFSLVSCWRWNGIHFLEDCIPFPYSTEKIPAPHSLPDGIVDMMPVSDYLEQWKVAAEKRHYPLPPEKQMNYWKKRIILARLWGFRECDSCYIENPYDFEKEIIEKTKNPKELFSPCYLQIGQAPNGQWGCTPVMQFKLCDTTIYGQRQYPDRTTAILHEIPKLKEKVRKKDDCRNKKEIFDWLDSLESSLTQPELFAFAG